MRKTLLIALAAAIPLLAVAGYAAAGGQSKLADVRDACDILRPVYDRRNRNAARHT